MRIPIDWLKELVSFRAGADQLAEMLTNAGLETIALPGEILDVDILPNRADCWSVRGIAREVSAITKFKMKPSRLAKTRFKESGKKITGSARIEVREKELCPRYMARIIENIKVGESPEWLKKKLEEAGLRSINNIVDATNYILHEIGQPMHAFDADLIQDKAIIVRRANPGEKATTLDGKEHELDPEVLVIADPEKVIAIAGVMGSANTEVQAGTKTVILESAYFNPISIHKTSKQLKLRTEASIRFEYGVDFAAVEEALDAGAALIAELGRGIVYKGKLDLLAKERKPKVIELRYERVNQVLGASIPVGDMVGILKRLGFKAGKADAGKIKVEVPLFRAMDIEREVDLIEEIARIWGFGRIEPTMPDTAFTGKMSNREAELRERIRQAMIGCGLTEAQSCSMLGPKDFEKIGLSLDQAIKIANPLTIEESIMRPDLLTGLLKVIAHNQNRQVENIFIFEIGKIFSPSKDKLPNEKWHLAVTATGSPFMSALDKGEADYFFVKGILENLLRDLGVEPPKVYVSENYWLQPGKSAEIEGLGFIGALHSDIQRNFELNRPVFCFEIDLDVLIKKVPEVRRYTPLPKFPMVTRDISMFIPPELENQMIIEMIKKTGGNLVEDTFPFDKYKDSTAYRVVYRHPERTLTEEEVNARHQEIIAALTGKLMVRVR